ncbi:zinc finger protein 570-like [Erpetoichthys calabaricus]|uniref:Zinc finger protein 570-like n=1 Tax=Erpetoichthys calabaricus TaxID=27687 RepID=A0A8C4RKA6_ERPCA|nr:zinc finger protein 570-like [Erpetoichthys calabaricus]
MDARETCRAMRERLAGNMERIMKATSRTILDKLGELRSEVIHLESDIWKTGDAFDDFAYLVADGAVQAAMQILMIEFEDFIKGKFVHFQTKITEYETIIERLRQCVETSRSSLGAKRRDVICADGIILRQSQPSEDSGGPGAVDGQSVTAGGSTRLTSGCKQEPDLSDSTEMKSNCSLVDLSTSSPRSYRNCEMKRSRRSRDQVHPETTFHAANGRTHFGLRRSDLGGVNVQSGADPGFKTEEEDSELVLRNTVQEDTPVDIDVVSDNDVEQKATSINKECVNVKEESSEVELSSRPKVAVDCIVKDTFPVSAVKERHQLLARQNCGPVEENSPFKIRKDCMQMGGVERLQQVHFLDMQHTSDDCSDTMGNVYLIRKHRRSHSIDEPYQCTECGKMFRWTGSLKIHQRIHTGEKPYKCAECGKTFNQAGHLRSHQKIHTRDKPFNCTECGKTFKWACSLKIHQRIHTGEKPYQCIECGKTFNQAGHLSSHQKIHTRDKPFNCSECGKTFKWACSLKMHQRIHTQEKPYQCTECGKAFNQNVNLKHHQRVHAGDKQYQCVECGDTFRMFQHLRYHQKIHMGEQRY